MKGATPVGPRTSTTMSTNAKRRAWAGTDQRLMPPSLHLRHGAGWHQLHGQHPATTVTTTQPLIAVVLPWNAMRPSTSNAARMLVARKNTHARQTTWNTTMRCTHSA